MVVYVTRYVAVGLLMSKIEREVRFSCVMLQF